MSDNVFEAVVEIMSMLFGVDRDSLTLDSSMDTIEQWDSLQHINVIVDVEQRFGIFLSPDEVMELNNVRSIVDLVRIKLQR